MPTTVTRKQASKGTVQIRSSNSRLQLRFSYQGIRHCLSIGLADTPANRKAATAKAKWIEAEIAYERLDVGKLKTSATPRAETGINVYPSSYPSGDLQELWSKFIDFKAGQCSPSTMAKQYRTFTNYVEKLPTHDIEQAGEILSWVTKNIPPDSAKRFLTRLGACCKWAMQTGLIESNPFAGKASLVKLPKSSNGDEIDPFTMQERDQILDALKQDRFCSKFSQYKHSHYWGYAYFCFYVGARPSEVVGLQWRHIELDPDPAPDQKEFGRIRIVQAVVESEDGRVTKKGLQTHERRDFPINRQLYDFLISIRPEGVKASDPVFPAYRGGWFSPNNFGNRIWRPVLDGLGIRHRKPYCCRHTFITLMLQAKVPIPDVARLSGNSPGVILKHYAGFVQNLVIPEL